MNTISHNWYQMVNLTLPSGSKSVSLNIFYNELAQPPRYYVERPPTKFCCWIFEDHRRPYEWNDIDEGMKVSLSNNRHKRLLADWLKEQKIID